MLTITKDNKATTYGSLQDATDAGLPQADIDAARAEMRVKQIKAECRRRIYVQASTETQMNMAAAAAVISAKTATARSTEEKAVLAGLEAAIGWVAEMRATVATLAADPGADVLGDASWPDVPAQVSATTDLF